MTRNLAFITILSMALLAPVYGVDLEALRSEYVKATMEWNDYYIAKVHFIMGIPVEIDEEKMQRDLEDEAKNLSVDELRSHLKGLADQFKLEAARAAGKVDPNLPMSEKEKSFTGDDRVDRQLKDVFDSYAKFIETANKVSGSSVNIEDGLVEKLKSLTKFMSENTIEDKNSYKYERALDMLGQEADYHRLMVSQITDTESEYDKMMHEEMNKNKIKELDRRLSDENIFKQENRQKSLERSSDSSDFSNHLTDSFVY